MKQLFFVIAFLLTAISAKAQPSGCQSWDKRPVPYIADFQLNNVGVARKDNFGNPIIIMNPNVLNQFPPLAQQFWYAHECAHHALHPQNNSEVNADCFAVRNLRNIGLVTNDQQFQAMSNSLLNLPGNMWSGHLPGPQRVNRMYQCINS